MRISLTLGVVLPALALLPAVAHSGESIHTARSKPVNLASAPRTTLPAASATGLATAPLILSAPPRDSQEAGHRIFGPIASYLSTVLGRPVTYRHPATWGGYQADMLAGAYDIVFDGPHFNSWRIRHLGHNALVKIPGEFVYTAVVRSDNTAVTQLAQLAGHKICAHAPPNLGTLIMYDQFNNPARQPVVMVEEGYAQIYQGLLQGKCDAAMLPLGHLQKLEKDRPRTRIVFRTTVMPQQAFSAGPHLSVLEQARVAEALQTPAAAMALTEFRKIYGVHGNFMPATNAEYANLSRYLKDVWGFNE